MEDVPHGGKLFTAQAPQCFYLGNVPAAHEKVRTDNPAYEGLADACTLMKAAGKDAAIVRGNRGIL